MQLIIEARHAGEILRHNQIAWAVWHVVALGRKKKLPNLKTLQVTRRAAVRRQTWQEQFAIMEMWATAMKRLDAQQKGR